MSSSIHLESTAVSELAQRIRDARKLYGNDSPYVIGLMTAVEWIAQGAEGGQGLKQDLLARVLESEGKKQPSRPLPSSAESSPPAHERRTLAESSPPAHERRTLAESSPPAHERPALTENSWTRGIVKWFNTDKGYGFISTDGHVDVFVHWRDISSWDRTLTQGDEVEFMVTRTAKGFQAINVMKADQDKAEEEADSVAAVESAAETVEAEAAPAPAESESEGSTPDPQGDEDES